MSKVLKNLTLPHVVHSMEVVLATYPDYPHQTLLANPDHRQELVAFVLSRVQNIYCTIDDAEVPHPEKCPLNSAQQSCLEAVIHEGIQQVLEGCQDKFSLQLLNLEHTDVTSSHWFG